MLKVTIPRCFPYLHFCFPVEPQLLGIELMVGEQLENIRPVANACDDHTFHCEAPSSFCKTSDDKQQQQQQVFVWLRFHVGWGFDRQWENSTKTFEPKIFMGNDIHAVKTELWFTRHFKTPELVIFHCYYKNVLM